MKLLQAVGACLRRGPHGAAWGQERQRRARHPGSRQSEVMLMQAQGRFTGWRTVGIALAMACAPTFAAEPAIAEPTAAAPVVDPVAIGALKKMGAALVALPGFTLQSDASIELVLDGGQKIELDQPIRYQVTRPDKLRVDIVRHDFERHVIFDGSRLTLWAPKEKFYASTPTEAGTIAELLANASERYDIDLPLTDLFLWGTDAAPVSAITTALHVGRSMVDGDAVQQYAFRQPGVDWQVWISDATSLPRKLVIVTHDDPALPKFTTRLDWETKTAVADEAFAFTPPADATEIVLVPVDVAIIDVDTEEN
ncbi:DUF2092 domain-containing protein [Luteimonas kalidii]|uniref:DUF2092 domain-containing protein n=1 Tax=Luteimonas kalidii TaxID=3042025 RepID=A0ABT6JSB3_9GAMM|nr:DUF2092 domain-containing protein [Luteimonas kalidii]MDH5833576.1 DUF2092 domain-containing protein [Luteimonas kalidii]